MAYSGPLAGIILAAGKGTRMKSELPKGLHLLCGLPLVEHVGRALRSVGVRRPILVIGYQGDLIRAQLGDEHYAYAYQLEQMGTGHAALMVREMLESHHGPVLIVPGDVPLVSEEILRSLVETHTASGSDATLASCRLQRPYGYGRVVRDDDGAITRIVEEKDASEEERSISEINSSVYCFDAEKLFEVLPKLGNRNAQGEYYLTDAIAAIREAGGSCESVIFDDPAVLLGVNDRWQLAEAGAVMRKRILKRHALNGVTIDDPDNVHIGPDVTIGPDTTILGMTMIEGATKIGSGCIIGPFSRVADSEIGDGCQVMMSHLNLAVLHGGVRCGPFANLRPGATIGERARVGNFVEVKNSELGAGVSASHLTYLGDTTVGAGSNIGAGTITCNYDGRSKHETTIGENVFVGSNSTLIAPVTIGQNAFIAAGSVITKDVPDGALGIGRTRQEVKDGWAKRWRKKE